MTDNTTLDQPVVLAEAAFGRCELRTSTVEGDQIHIHAKSLIGDRIDHDLGWYDPAGLMRRLAHFVSAPKPADGSLGVDGDGRLWLYREWGRNGNGGWVLHENNGLRQRSAGRTAEYVATHFRGFTRLHPLHIPTVSPDLIAERIRVGEDTYLPAVNVVAWMTAAAAAVAKAKSVNAVHWADVAGEIERLAAAPSVEQIAHAVYLHGMWATGSGGVCTAPDCDWTSDLLGVDRRDAFNAHVGEVIRSLYGSEEPNDPEMWAMKWKRDAEKAGVRAKAAESQVYANGDEIVKLTAALLAAEEHIAALNREYVAKVATYETQRAVLNADAQARETSHAAEETRQAWGTARAAVERPCSCGSPTATALTPGEWIDHRPDACRIMRAATNGEG